MRLLPTYLLSPALLLLPALIANAAEASGGPGGVLVYPNAAESFNPRVACIPPEDRPGGGKFLAAEAEFQYALAPYVKFPSGGKAEAEIRDNGRHEAKDILSLSNGTDHLVVRVARSTDGGKPMLAWLQGGKVAVSASLDQALPRDWTHADLRWTGNEATLSLNGQSVKISLPAHADFKSVGLETAQVTSLKIDGDGSLALNWDDGYAAHVAPGSDAQDVSARFFGFDTYLVSQDSTKRDYPMVQVINGSSTPRTVKFDYDMGREVANAHQQWSQQVDVGPHAAAMVPIAFPAALTSDVYHLAIHSASFQPNYAETRNFAFVENRHEPAGPSKFGLQNSARHLFGSWPDALPVNLSVDYATWGVVVGPPWIKDPGMNPSTPPDQWNWDPRIDWAIDQGLTSYVSLQSMPYDSWARAREYPGKMKKQGWGESGGFPRLDLYRKFVHEVALRYRGKVHFYEVENEPMAGAGIPPADYVEIAKVVSEEVHAVDPDAQVFGICGTGDFVSWMKQVFDLGGAKYLDGVSVHTYVTPNMPENAGLPAKLAEVDKLIKQSGRPLRLLNSETGTFVALRERVDQPISPSRLDELIKAGTHNLSVKAGWPFHAVDERAGGISVVRNAVYNFLAGAEDFTFFGYNPAWPPANWWDGASLFSGEHGVDDCCWAMISCTRDGQRTPSLFTLAAGVLTEQLHGADQRQGRPVSDDGLAGGIFPKANGGEVAVLWSPSGRRSVLVQAADPHLELVSMLGGKQTLTSSAATGPGLFHLEIGQEPVYLHADHPGIRLLPSPVVDIAQDVSARRTGFHFTLVDTFPSAWQGTIDIAVPHGWKASLASGSFSLAQGARGTFAGTYEVPPGLKKGSYSLNASVKLPDGTPFHFPVSINVRPNFQVSTVPETFAWSDPASWTGVQPALTLDQANQVVIGRPPPLASLQEEKYWKGSAELSAEVRVAANGNDLFLYALVRDANLHPPTTWPGVVGSCVELFLDARTAANGLGHAPYSTDVHQLLIKPETSATAAPLAISDATAKSRPIENIRSMGGKNADGRYWIALQIPWKSLGHAGTPLGFDLGIDGATADGAGRKSQMMLFGSAQDNTDASGFGLAQFSPANFTTTNGSGVK